MSKLSAVTLLLSKNLNSCDRLLIFTSKAQETQNQEHFAVVRDSARLCETLRESCWCSRPTLVCWCTGKVRALIGIMSTLTLCEEVHNIRALAMHTIYCHFKHEQTCSSYYNSLQAYQLSIEFVSVCFPMCSLWFLMIHRSSWTFMDLHSNTKPHWCWLLSFDWTSSHFEGGHPEDLSTGRIRHVSGQPWQVGDNERQERSGKYQKWWMKIEKISCGNCNEMKYMKYYEMSSFRLKTTLKHSETTERVKRVTATGTCSSISSSRKEMNSRGLMPPGARRCKDPIRTRSPIALVVCHVKLNEVHIGHGCHGCHGLSSSHLPYLIHLPSSFFPFFPFAKFQAAFCFLPFMFSSPLLHR